MPRVVDVLSKNARRSVEKAQKWPATAYVSRPSCCVWLCLLFHRRWHANTTVLWSWSRDRPGFFFFYCRIPIVRMCDQKLSSCVMRINCSHSHSFGGGRGWTESHFISPKFKYFATELPTEEQNKPLEHKFIPVWYKLPGICIFFYQSTAVSGGSLQPGSVSLTCRQRLASLSVPVGSEVVKPQRTSAQWTLFIKAPWWLPDVPLGVRQS